VTRPGRTTTHLPPLAQFITRRFAVRSPWPSWVVFERLGGVVAYLFARIGLPPAVATLLGGAAGITGSTLLVAADDGMGVLLAAVALLLGYVFDCADGQLARATHRTSAVGAWLDVTVDAVVTAFVATSLTIILLADGATGTASLLVAGAFGASRVVSLFTATHVRRIEGSGMRLTGLTGSLRTVYVGLIDTPVVYVALCASRLVPELFRAVIVIVTVLTVVQTLVSARHNLASSAPEPAP